MYLRPRTKDVLFTTCACLLGAALFAGTAHGLCADKADADPDYARFDGGHAVWLPGIGTDFVFDPDLGSFTENGDGTATLTGTVRSASDPSRGFEVDVSFSDRTASAPAGSPHLELVPAAYADNGGPIDPSTWYYYETWGGMLTGIDALAGASVAIARRGAAFQVGQGANGKNLEYGASGWLDYMVLSQPAGGGLPETGDGDINVDLAGCPSDNQFCVQEALSDANLPGYFFNHAVYLPGITKKLIFDPPGQFVEYPDGTARLTGTAVDRNVSSRVFVVDVVLSGRTTTPPPGSPKLELAPDAYVSGGGSIDPSTWSYYESFSGTLTGQGQYDGAVIEIVRTGPAWQTGVGANNKNDNFGASAWFDWNVLSQPTTGVTLQETGVGDFNVDLGVDCVPTPQGSGKIGDLVWHDLDRDGVQDAGEPGLQGVLVRLYLDGELINAKFSNATGYYFLDKLPAGSYSVEIDLSTLPEGLEPTFDLDGTSSPHTAALVLGDGEIRLDVDFGYAEPPPPPPQGPVRPILECVTDHGDGTYTAYFGYLSQNDVPVTLPVGSENRFSPAPQDRGQPTTFQPGRTPYWPDAAFAVTWGGGNLVWVLDGRTSTASPSSTPCSNHVFVDKAWRDAAGEPLDAPPADLPSDFEIVVESEMGTATCRYPAGSSELSCVYDNQPPALDDNGLWVPVGSTYTVTENNAPAGYGAEGLGTYTVQAETCTPGVDGLVKYCLHTVVNTAVDQAPCLEGKALGVHDAGSSNSQLFVLDTATGQVEALGPRRDGYDIEALEISPLDNRAYAIAGGGGSHDGDFYGVDKLTGELTLLGNTGAAGNSSEIAAASFHPDGTLWGFQKGVGLLTIDLQTAATTVVWTVAGSGASSTWEGLAWGPDGDYLYGSDGSALYRWDPVTQAAERICTNLPNQTEALDLSPEGVLLGGWHNAADASLRIFAIDPASCTISATDYQTPYNDVESLAFEQCGPAGATPVFHSGFEDGGTDGWTVTQSGP